jgi:eukaryotic-like serine/threonine-protein kinase
MVNDAERGIPAPVSAMRDDDSGPQPSQLVGHSIAGKFVVEALIASGGAGTVYRARQLALDRIVALKLLRQDVARDVHFVERFKREARAASRLDHPNSVRVFDFGHVDESLLYLAMEYVEGRTLHQMIDDEWPLGEARIVDIMSQVLSAIAVAHDMEVIHRDLKPDNIMIIRGKGDDGEETEIAKVCDFGIATLGAVQNDRGGAQAGGPWATMDGSLVGTPGYMSPEQARGESADRRSDIYSAGVILYHLLTGRPPFDGDSAYFVAMKHITDAPLAPSELTAVDPGLEKVCLRALSKAPRDRFDNAREMRAALRAALARSTPAGERAAQAAAGLATPAPQAPNTVDALEKAGIGSSARRRRASAVFAGLAAVGLVAGALATKSRFRSEPPLPSAAIAMTPAVAAPPAIPTPAGIAPAPPVSAPVARAASGAVAPKPIEAPPTPRRPAKHRAIPVAAVPPPGPAAAPAAAPVPVATTTPAPVRMAVTSPPPSTPPAPRIDVDHATASITGITTTSAIPGSAIRAALARVPLVRCYRDALRAGGLASASATLRLRIDSGGYVTSAALQGAGVTPALKSCIEKGATALRIKDVDTGDATADVTLGFVAAP